MSQREPEPGWYIVDSDRDHLVHRGPYKHVETAVAVRDEMELSRDDEDFWGDEDDNDWNLCIVWRGPKSDEEKT